MLNRLIGSFCRRHRQQHGVRPIVNNSVNWVSTIFSFGSWIIYILIGYRYPFVWYWLALLGKTPARCSLTHHENQRQWRVNDLWFSMSGNYTVISLLLCITDVLAAFICKRNRNTITAPFSGWVSMICGFVSPVINQWLSRSHTDPMYWQIS
jgi:hypothetical protein